MVVTGIAARLLPRCASGFGAHGAARILQTPTRFTANSVRFEPWLPPIAPTAIRCRAMSSTDIPRRRKEKAEQQLDEIVLFELGSKRLLRVASGASVVVGIYWMGYLNLVDSLPRDTGFEAEPWWGILGSGMTGILMVSSYIFAKKLVDRLAYLPSLHAISFVTHHFSSRRREPKIVPIGNVISATRMDKRLYIPFKVKGEYGFNLMDVNEGVFHNKELMFGLLEGTISADMALKMSRGEVLEDGSEPVHLPVKFSKRGKKNKDNK